MNLPKCSVWGDFVFKRNFKKVFKKVKWAIFASFFLESCKKIVLPGHDKTEIIFLGVAVVVFDNFSQPFSCQVSLFFSQRGQVTLTVLAA